MQTLGPRANFNASLCSTFCRAIRSIASGREAAGRRPQSFIHIRLLAVPMCAALIFCAGLLAPRAQATSGTLAFSPASASFGSVTVGSSKTISVSITNTGKATVTFSKESLIANSYTVTGFSMPRSLAAGKSMTISVKFTPLESGNASGFILFLSNASNARIGYGLSGAGVSGGSGNAQLSSTPASANLGTAPVGSTNSLSLQWKNTGSSALSISAVSLTGSAAFKLCNWTFPVSIGVGQAANCAIQFTPSAAGSVSASASISFSGNGANKTLVVLLSGQGTTSSQTLSATPTSLNFGNVVEGKAETLSVTLKNTGNASVVVSGVTTSSSALTTSGGIQGATIGAGQSATLHVQFLPKSAGTLNGSVTIASNAAGSPLKIGVAADGITGTKHSVALNWNASTSPSIAGYYVYRALLPGGAYTRLNTSALSGTNYSDGSVVSGDTYSYQVTAVDAKGNESTPSGQVSAEIP